MIDIKHLAANVERYAKELEIRGWNPHFANEAAEVYELWKNQKIELDELLQKKNDFNKSIWSLSAEEKQTALGEMKKVSDDIKEKEALFKETGLSLTKAVAKIPNLTYDGIPVGKSDADNPVVQVWWEKPSFDFKVKPYYELEVYKKYVERNRKISKSSF